MSRDPKSYRFQIREHTREERPGVCWNTYGRILWTEKNPVDPSVIKRCNKLCEKADQLAEETGGSVAAGLIATELISMNIPNPDLFEAVYFVSPQRQLTLVKGGKS